MNAKKAQYAMISIILIFLGLVGVGIVIFTHTRGPTGAAVEAPKCSGPQIGGYCGCYDVHGDGTISWKGLGETCPQDDEWNLGCPPGFLEETGTDCEYDKVDGNDLCCIYP